MPAKPPASTEWVDGFLFIGNQLALDFLNTRPVLPDGPTELLTDVAALVRWLRAAGVLSDSKEKLSAAKWTASPHAEKYLKELLAFRERLRSVVLRLEAGQPLPESFIAEINSLLAKYPPVLGLRRQGRGLVSELGFHLREPEDAWGPIAGAVAELLSAVPAGRVRKCEACVLHYQDVSKKGSRRWCSMSICGNRVKVAAYQKRVKAAKAKPRSL